MSEQRQQGLTHYGSRAALCIGFYTLAALGVNTDPQDAVSAAAAEPVTLSWSNIDPSLSTTIMADGRSMIPEAMTLTLSDGNVWDHLVTQFAEGGKLDVINARAGTDLDYQRDATCLSLASYIAARSGQDRISAAQALQRNTNEGGSPCDASTYTENFLTIGQEITEGGFASLDDRLWRESQQVALMVLDGALADPDAAPREARPVYQRVIDLVVTGVAPVVRSNG